ncbi:MAG: TonB-dependent receptor [Longimicrobiales bacterium]|nr:TonB-dependent receptor [Longimicrobiales bacterium]
MSLLPRALAAQDGVLRGQIVDALTRAPVAGAEVALLRAGEVDAPLSSVGADGAGTFRFSGLEPGLYTVRAHALGYAEGVRSEIPVRTSRPTFVLLELHPRAVEVAGITVTGGAFDVRPEAPVSATLLSAAEVRRTPGGLQDVSRTLLSLPGVVGGVDNRNDLLVRGGGPGENAYYLDGIRIPQINHFATQGATGGALGLVNVDFIRETEFYRGGFPVRYGNALSSVLVIENRPGTREGVRGDVTLGAAEAGLTLDGPLGGNADWLFSVRRSYLQFLFAALDLPIRPDYWDGQLRAEWRPSERDRVVLVGIGAVDDFDIVAPDGDDLENVEIFERVIDNDQRTGTLGATWQRLAGRGVLRLAASHSVTDYRFRDLDGNGVEVLRNRSLERETPLRLEGDFRVGGSGELSFGLRLARRALEADFFQRATPGASILEDLRFDTRLTSWDPGAFLQAGFGAAGGRARLTLGVRWDDVGVLEDGARFSPRGSLSLRVAEAWTLSAAAGLFHQAPALLSVAVEEEGAPVNRGLDPIRNVQVVAGAAWQPDAATRFSLEAFWKRYSAYPVSRDDPRISLANLGGDFGFVGGEPLVSRGKGRAYGVELFAQRKLTGRVYALGAYTLSRSDFSGADGVLKPSAWDVRHALDLTAGYRAGERWELGGKLRLLSGRPFTPFDAARSAAEFPITGRGVPDWARIGAERTPVYARLDVRAERRFDFSGWNASVYLDVQNVLARSNPVGFLYTLDPAFPDNRRPVDGTALLPFFGFSVEF